MAKALRLWRLTINRLLHTCQTHRYLFAVVGLWLTIMVLGFRQLHSYGSTAGGAGAAPQQIAVGTLAPMAHDGPRLVFFAHPHCPCTRASLVELAVILELSQQDVAAEVHFVRPPGVPAGWEKTASWDAAARLPGVRVFCDEGGVWERRPLDTQFFMTMKASYCFAEVSPARGQAGDSTGRRAILALLAGKAAPAESMVFGCPLLNASTCGLSNGCSAEGGSCQSCQ